MISDWEAVSPASSAGASCAKAGMEMAAATQDAPTSSLVYFCMVLLLNTENRSPGEPAIFLFSACFGAYPAALNLRGGAAVSCERVSSPCRKSAMRRSEVRRVGKECVRSCQSRWEPDT